jgi:hypothetical protein
MGKIWGDRITPKAIWYVVKAARRVPAPTTLLPMICAAAVHGYVIWREVSLSRFSFCSGTRRLRRLSAIWAASRTSTMP